jgi:hypothetical protein
MGRLLGWGGVRRTAGARARALGGWLCAVLSALLAMAGALGTTGGAAPVYAENNGLAQTPPLGWSSWSFIRKNPTQANIEAQAAAMQSTGLAAHGYQYVNLDDFWYVCTSGVGPAVDQYGRWVPDTSRFPSGIAPVAAYVHGLGLKFGLYVTPGISAVAVSQNTPIQGTAYHAQDVANTAFSEKNYNCGHMDGIDYTKPGAQAFVDSWADLFASWGVDYLKIDGVGTSDVGDIQAWSSALQQSGRPIHLELSNSLALGSASTWRQYANGWRISGDVECYCSNGLTDWSHVSSRFGSAPNWTHWAGPGGWNDLDSLDVGNGVGDGLSNDQRQSYMSLWALAAAPLLNGDDLTNLDAFGLGLLTNDEVIGLDQQGVAGAPVVYNASQQVWRSPQPDGSYAVGLFNLSSSSATVTVNWSDLGFTGSAGVHEMWRHADLGTHAGSYSATLNPFASSLLRVTPAVPVTGYEAESPANTLGGGARLASCAACSGGQKVGFLGNGGTLTVGNVAAAAAGTYNLTISYLDGDAGRSADVSVNGASPTLVSFPGTGSFTNNEAGYTLAVRLSAGSNTITISNPTAYAPDVDRLTVAGAGGGGYTPTSYEAESPANTLGGGARVASCSACSGGAKVGYVGNGGTLQFNGIAVPSSGSYQLTIAYCDGDSGRAGDLSVDGGTPTVINFPTTGGWGTPGTLTVTLSLGAGTHTITFSNPSAYAPDFDRIVV